MAREARIGPDPTFVSAVAPMEPEVAHLSARDRLDIAAYLASLGEISASANAGSR